MRSRGVRREPAAPDEEYDDGSGRGAARGPGLRDADVAREAGVSLATASRVLNGTSQVRADLRERVLASAAELSYTPNAHAQALASSSSKSIGVVCHDVSDPTSPPSPAA